MSGGGEGLKIRTSSGHPVTLSVSSQTVLSLNVDTSSTFYGDLTVNGAIRPSNIITSAQPFLHVSASALTIPTSGGGAIIPYSLI